MRQGDPDAVRELRRRHSGSIYALAYMLMGDTGSAEQVETETFQRAQRTASRFNPKRISAFGWLAGIARRQARFAAASIEQQARALDDARRDE
jgi:DNA-directed RNA polymerase specialized sigma24 family protein